MKELLSHSEAGENEIEALQKLARVDDSIDETVIVRKILTTFHLFSFTEALLFAEFAFLVYST
jgi:hypothetical protein